MESSRWINFRIGGKLCILWGGREWNVRKLEKKNSEGSKRLRRVWREESIGEGLLGGLAEVGEVLETILWMSLWMWETSCTVARKIRVKRVFPEDVFAFLIR
ncbi:hypothetical protein Adt_41554 [Abeliophyllum distichum]|uniref:Uncharacterized protein n=1 Tax=Abeliophyllum distichum TaxID=126358 RepID=A0ABD1PP69_9LAMI